ncbi:DUF1778 domain-containing protein [Klebsiella pneumoniae]|nr:DUF1778 domain-containing protein [Klebsiella pneumoniae]
MGSCAAPSAKGDDKFITADYLQQCLQLNLRAKESQRALIDAAAEILHKSRTDFILEMACKAAENVILDRRVFNFNDEQYAEFIDMLDAPVEDEPAINKLLARKPQWDV